MKNKILLLAVIVINLMTSCNEDKNLDILGMFTSVSASSNERFQESMKYNESHGYDKLIVNQEDYRLYVMSDTHIDFTTSNLDTFVSTYLSDVDAAPFALHLGDQINASKHWDYYAEHVQPIADAGRKLYHTLGNHDIYYDQWDEFVSRWHTASYWFEVVTPSNNKDLYICLDSANGTLGTEQRDWLEDLLTEKSQQGYRNIIIFTHTHFFKKDTAQGHTSNFTMEETYDLTDLFSKYKVDMVLQGHSHSRDYTIFKGVEYLRVDAINDLAEDAFYAILTVGEKINYDFIKVN